MAPAVIDVRNAGDLRDVVHRAVQTLAEGQLVAFPTETVYGLAAHALDAAAVSRLIAAKGRQAGHPFPLAVRCADDAADYLPEIGSLGRRLARRCWPGPLTLVMPDNHPQSLVRQLPESVQRAVLQEGTLGLRVPAHPLIHDVLRLLPGPLVLTSANRTGQPSAVTAEEVAGQLGSDVALILNDGRCRYGQASTVVRIEGSDLRILRQGVVSESAVRRLASFVILFVCTGNTCRSPMAEWLCRQKLAERLGCSLEDLEERGWLVMSAGVAASAGGRATSEAIETLRARGLDLSRHESQPVTDRLARMADRMLTMTRGHRDTLLRRWPEAADRIHPLVAHGVDVADPIGGPLESYRRCAEQIAAAIDAHIDQVVAERGA